MSSPYHKGLMYTGRVRAVNSEAENITPTAYDDLMSSSSPYYKGLTDQALLTIKKRETQSTTISSSSSKTSMSSPYCKGLVYTERDCVANSEAKNVTPTAYISSSSPYYKGLTDQALLTVRNRESQSTTLSSSSSKTSFSDKKQNWTANCFKSRHPLSPHFPPSSPAKRAVINAKETRDPMEEMTYPWVDKYRPADLENYINKKDKAIKQKQKQSDESCPLFISEGVTKPRMFCEQAHDKRKTFKMKVCCSSF